MNLAALRRRWLQAHRFRRTLYELRSLPAHEIRALGIAPEQFATLAAKAARLH
jgi:uncharacterized protein YjiS (DUF1127 family)